MLGPNKKINAGDESTNIQGEKVYIQQIQQGLSYSQVKEVAMDVFKSNFYELSELAKATALERAEQLVNRFLLKLEHESPYLVDKIQEPDVQYAVINAQKQYARNGQPETLELLSSLLKTRFQIEEGSLKGIVLNEAIDAMSKLTINQIKFITALFLVKNCKLPKVRTLIEVLSKVMTDQLVSIQREPSIFEHLIFVGVAAVDVTESASQNLEYFIRSGYSDELEGKIEGITLDVLDPPVRKQFINDSLSESVFEKWNNSIISRYALTTVGKAIAVAYLNAVMNTNINLDIWIKG
jgi:hypothetical protein